MRGKPHFTGLIALIIGVLALSGCTTTISGSASLPGQRADHPKAQLWPDRDEPAVTAALRGLDACKLLGGYLQAHAGSAAIPNGPHSCLLSPKADWSPLDPSMTLAVGVKLDHVDRLMQKPVTVDGVKAYLQDASEDDRSSCTINIPTSFRLGVSLSDRVDGQADTCGTVQDVAKSIIAGLRAPDQNALDTSKRPFSAWDGCTFIRGLLGKGRPFDFAPDGLTDPLSGCHATLSRAQGEYPTSNGVSFSAAYEKWEPIYGGKDAQLGGKQASISTSSLGCQVKWDQGSSGTGNEWLGDLVFELESDNGCDVVQAAVQKAVTLATQAPPVDTTKPSRPLFYTEAEHDDAFTGPCVNFSGATGEDCQPYQNVPIPQTLDERMKQPQTDTNVLCAMFNAQVKAAFGPTLEPLTYNQNCYYVQASAGLSLEVEVNSRAAPYLFGRGADLYTGYQVTTIGGKQAVTFSNTEKSDYDIYLSPYNDIHKPGYVHLQVQTSEPRGVLRSKIDPLDATKATLADQVMAKAVEAYFS
ncbi:MAG: hypothetical protein JWQ81_601 [Amycolatopsis sp.]|uniref:DUF3558 family protein n=1 Tax=Amycolatopsis sp. TaxID=37632 RepID=UPI00261A143D|nr:DUF3558 family protein [Amycolatopsis sp.]MCU1679862.1 hypothetical protein [Amycolatopsis sp.]